MEYIFAGLVLLFASILQGISGFGSGLVAVPLLALWFPLTILTPTLSIINVVMAALIYWRNRHAARPSQWKVLLFAGVSCSLLAGILLTSINEQGLKLAIGLIIITVALLLMLGKQLPTAQHNIGYCSVGSIAGILNGLTTLGGPPIVLFLANARMAKTEFRATLSLFFLCIGIANVCNFSVQQLYQRDHLYLTLMLVPCAIIGASLGQRLQNRVSEHRFRQFTLTLMLASGVVITLQNL